MCENLSRILQKKINDVKGSDRELIPDFMIISTSKTGTTWLWKVLSETCADIFLPPFLKELNYFCVDERIRNTALEEYLSFFRGGEDSLKGEASPSYVLLPVSVIKEIKHLNPGLKLIFLMREPADRAWSHLKHMIRFGEVKNASVSSNIVFDHELFTEAFYHDFNVASGDYVTAMKRWIPVFGRESVYIDFSERIKDDPYGLLLDILDFMNIEKNVEDFKTSMLEKTHLKGVDVEAPDYFRYFVRLVMEDRKVETLSFLKDEFSIGGDDIPLAWKHESPESLPGNANVEEYNGYYLFESSSRCFAALKLPTGEYRTEELLSLKKIKNKFIEADSYTELKRVIDSGMSVERAFEYISPYLTTKEIYSDRYFKGYEIEHDIVSEGRKRLNRDYFLKAHVVWAWRNICDFCEYPVLFGAGQHTGWLMDIILEYRLLKPVLILDDNYEDEKFRGIPVVKPEDVEKDKIDVVVLSTDIWQRKFKKRVEEALPGMKTIDLYKGFVPGPYLLY